MRKTKANLADLKRTRMELVEAWQRVMRDFDETALNAVVAQFYVTGTAQVVPRISVSDERIIRDGMAKMEAYKAQSWPEGNKSRPGTFPRIWELMGYLLLPGPSKRVYPHVRDEMKRKYLEARSAHHTRGARIFLFCCYCWWTVAAFFGIWKEAGLDKLIKWLKWVLPPLLWWKLTHWLRIG